jgi:hypothetical protein
MGLMRIKREIELLRQLEKNCKRTTTKRFKYKKRQSKVDGK